MFPRPVFRGPLYLDKTSRVFQTESAMVDEQSYFHSPIRLTYRTDIQVCLIYTIHWWNAFFRSGGPLVKPISAEKCYPCNTTRPTASLNALDHLGFNISGSVQSSTGRLSIVSYS